MKREIYVVDAAIVDSNGTYNHLSGYPKTFDSHNYGDDIAKAKRRAEGDAAEVYGAMCKRDDRQLQTVIMMSADGGVLYRQFIGRVADLPDPEPEAEDEP